MRFLIYLSISLVLSLNISAQEKRVFSISPSLFECNETHNTNNIQIKSVDLSFDEETNELRIEASLVNANGINIAINSESSLRSSRYQIINFTIDGSNGSTPIVSAFTDNREPENNTMSNCNNNPGHWNTNPGGDNNQTEAIFPASVNGTNPSWVSFASKTNRIEGSTTITDYTIIINTTQFESFTPSISQNVYIGTAKFNHPSWNLWHSDFAGYFANEIVLDFVPLVISNAQYTNGLLTNLGVSSCSFCKISTSKNTNVAPKCIGVSSNQEVRVDDSVEVNFTFNDPNLFDSFTISYPELPANSTTNPANNSTVVPDSESIPATVTFSPSASQEGKTYTISSTLVQNYGTVQAGDTCSTTVTVLPSVRPVCESVNQADVSSELKKSTKKLARLLKKANKEAKKFSVATNRKYKSQAATIKRLEKDTTENLNIVPEQFLVCTKNTVSCDAVDYLGYYKLYTDALLQLHCPTKNTTIPTCTGLTNVGKALLRKWKKAKINFLRRNGSAAKSAKKQVNKEFRKKLNTINKIVENNYNSVFDTKGTDDSIDDVLRLEQFDFSCS